MPAAKGNRAQKPAQPAAVDRPAEDRPARERPAEDPQTLREQAAKTIQHHATTLRSFPLLVSAEPALVFRP